MDIEDVERVTVVGAGEMGRGIAAASALSGYETTLQDVDPDQLAAAEEHAAWSFDKQVEHGAATEAEADAALERFETTESLEEAVANPALSTLFGHHEPPCQRRAFQAGTSLRWSETMLPRSLGSSG